ncbi:unnamed protein product [Caenorhabditis nigoni]
MNNRGGSRGFPPRRSRGGRGNSRGNRSVSGNGEFRNDYSDRGSDRQGNPDGRSPEAIDRFPYRRSPSPRNPPFDPFVGRPFQDRAREDRSLTPEFRQMRMDERPAFDRNSARNNIPVNVRPPKRDEASSSSVTGNEAEQEWSLKIAAADEEVRHAEYLLHTAKIKRDIVIGKYKEFANNTYGGNNGQPKPAW